MARQLSDLNVSPFADPLQNEMKGQPEVDILASNTLSRRCKRQLRKDQIKMVKVKKSNIVTNGNRMIRN